MRTDPATQRLLPVFLLSLLALLSLLTLPGLLAAPSFARSLQESDQKSPQDYVVDWQKRMQSTHRLLQASDWSSAEVESQALFDELLSHLKAGEGSAALLAAATAQLALAESGLGKNDQAQWHLHLAQNLNPAFRDRGVEGYGIASQRLAADGLRAWNQPPPGSVVLSLASPDILPPSILESPHIVFRASEEILREFPQDLSVEVVVSPEGRPEHPVVRGSMINPTPVIASLEALRDWRFEPASRNGTPVAVFLYLPLPLTEGAVAVVKSALEEP